MLLLLAKEKLGPVWASDKSTLLWIGLEFGFCHCVLHSTIQPTGYKSYNKRRTFLLNDLLTVEMNRKMCGRVAVHVGR